MIKIIGKELADHRQLSFSSTLSFTSGSYFRELHKSCDTFLIKYKNIVFIQYSASKFSVSIDDPHISQKIKTVNSFI